MLGGIFSFLPVLGLWMLPLGLLLFLSLMFWGFCARLHLEHGTSELRRQMRLLVALYLVLLPPISYVAYGALPSSYGTWHAYALSYVLAVLIFLFGVFQAISLGHPLIPAARRISNDIRLDDDLRLLVISGSNMS